jgi:predicted RNase H-like nuclease (RuvC/YqgF family)
MFLFYFAFIGEGGGERMEQEAMLKEISKALKLHSGHIHAEIQQMSSQLRAETQEVGNQLRTEMREMVGKLEEKMDKRFNQLETKVDSLRIELSETQETVDFLSSKTLQHERKIRELYRQQ